MNPRFWISRAFNFEYNILNKTSKQMKKINEIWVESIKIQRIVKWE
jgi:hypothetical protein